MLKDSPRRSGDDSFENQEHGTNLQISFEEAFYLCRNQDVLPRHRPPVHLSSYDLMHLLLNAIPSLTTGDAITTSFPLNLPIALQLILQHDRIENIGYELAVLGFASGKEENIPVAVRYISSTDNGSTPGD